MSVNYTAERGYKLSWTDGRGNNGCHYFATVKQMYAFIKWYIEQLDKLNHYELHLSETTQFALTYVQIRMDDLTLQDVLTTHLPLLLSFQRASDPAPRIPKPDKDEKLQIQLCVA